VLKCWGGALCANRIFKFRFFTCPINRGKEGVREIRSGVTFWDHTPPENLYSEEAEVEVNQPLISRTWI